MVSSGVEMIDLGRSLSNGMPQSPNHPQFWHSLPRRHGDQIRGDGGSAANDLISMGTHVGTHIDALAHVSQDGNLYGGVDAQDACIGGKYVSHGVHTIEPMVRRGVMLDVARAKGVPSLDGAEEIFASDLELCLRLQSVAVTADDVVLIRSGWGSKFYNGSEYVGRESGVPGIGADGARWFRDKRVHAVGADSIAFEHLAPHAGHSLLPAHRILLVESGIYIIESLDLEELSARGIYEFVLVLVPMNIYGATGSPVRPLALIGA